MLKLSEKTMFLPPGFTVNPHIHFDSYMPLNNKFSLVFTIIFRSFTICSDLSKFHQEICKIKNTFIRNGYSESFSNKCVKTFLKRIIQTAETGTFKQLLPACDLKLIFKIFSRMNNYFNFKEKKN